MFARLVDAPAKPDKRNEIVSIVMGELLPVLKKQQGFVDFVGLTGDTSPDGATLTFWATKDDAERFYATQEFKSKILDRITPLVEHMTIRTFNVEASTFHKVAAAAAKVA